jgi:hypothetical protein
MISKSPTQTALSTLAHPLSLFSIIILLINDHLFKRLIPSFITGKLSDFAGLFFFPFLIAALLSIIPLLKKSNSRSIAFLAFQITGFWFILIKTSPLVNHTTVALARALLGRPTQIILDPTDLIALIILWPAWKLWMRVERTNQIQIPKRVSYLVISAASLAVLATSACPSPPSVRAIYQDDEKIYATVYPRTDYSHESSQGLNYTPYYSHNAGLTWHALPDEDSIAEQLPDLAMRERYVVACVPSDLNTCYQIKSLPMVEISTDGGTTWSVSWEIPPGRRRYMARALSMPRFSCGKRSLDTTPNGLLVVPLEDGNHSVIVNMGKEGLLIRNADGDWNRKALGGAVPTRSSGLSLATFPEGIFSGLASASIWLILWFPKRFRKRAGLSAKIAIAAFALAWMPLILWETAVIADYETALVLGVSMGLIGWIVGIRKLFLVKK